MMTVGFSRLTESYDVGGMDGIRVEWKRMRKPGRKRGRRGDI
jgi:hypothetical protein